MARNIDKKCQMRCGRKARKLFQSGGGVFLRLCVKCYKKAKGSVNAR